MPTILRNILAVALLIAAIVVLPWQAFAALTIDGSVTGGATGTSSTITLTTSLTNDVIILFCKQSSGSSATVTSVSDTAGLTWTKRKQGLWNTTNADQELWYAVSTGALTSDVITVTWAASISPRLTAFGINGANTASPFDGNASVPAIAAQTTSPTALSINTDNSDDMIITQYSCNSCSSIGRPAGFTQVLATGSITDIAYKIVSTPQTGLSVSYTSTNPNANGLLVDAVKAAPAATTQPLPDLYVPILGHFP